MARIGIVTGIAAEKKVLETAFAGSEDDDRPFIAIAAASPRRAEQRARGLAAAGVGALASVGIAGGLALALRPGDVLLPRAALMDGDSVEADAGWRRAAVAGLQSHGFRVDAGGPDTIIATVDEALADPHAKAAAARATGAVAVDMESFTVGRAARSLGLPFLILRVIADGPTRALPPAILGALDEEGRERPGRAVRNLLARPQDFWPLLLLARDTRRALRVLGRVAAAAGPRLLRP